MKSAATLLASLSSADLNVYPYRCAVVRNRARRRLREVYRLNETRLKSGYDIVIVARHAAATAPFDQLQADFLALCAQLSLLSGEH